MTGLSPALSSSLGRFASPPSALALRAASPAAGAAAAAAAPAQDAIGSTHVSLGATAGLGVGYPMPPALNLTPRRFWAGAHDDALSVQMLHNLGSGSVKLKDLWRGLGGELLRQLAATGEGRQQTLAELPPRPDDLAAMAALDATTGTTEAPDAVPEPEAAKLEADALNGVATNAVKVQLTLTTRSGQTVNLEMAINDGQHGGTRGLQLQVSPSGPLSAAERDALAAMAGALDQALDGLGQATPKLDLSPLRAFNTSGELTGLDLAIEDPNAPSSAGALRAFSLHMDADKTRLSLKRTGSEMALTVAATAPNAIHRDLRQSAIVSMLAQIDAAAERGHADRSTARLFQEAFRQLQTPPTDNTAAAPAEADPASEAQALQSGLADFEASFSGLSHKHNRYGGVIEQGTLDYRIGQTTTSTLRGGHSGEPTITQVKTEAADASIQKTRTLLLDIASGNYDNTSIRDRSTETTVIDMAGSAVKRALRKTDEHRLSVFTSLEHDRVTARRETPVDKSHIERLR